MNLPLVTRALFETARISVPTVWDSVLGTLDHKTCSRRLESWSERLLKQAQIELDVVGAELAERDKSYVIMSNHQSLYDVPVLFQALPVDLRMVAKAELFRIPIWGTAMEKSGFVRIDRSRGREARAILAEKGRALKADGLSLWIAPEGTRSPSGELLPFRSGGFELALSLELPILPVRIDGTQNILKKKSKNIRRGARVSVEIFTPVSPEPGEERSASVLRLKERVFLLLSKRDTSP